MLGFGIDPMSILVPFLIFAIGVSHGVQMVSAFRAEVYEGSSSLDAAQIGFRKLIVPGSIALLSDTIGFITIMLIKIRMIQEMAITASLGVAVIILTDLMLVPVLLSYVNLDEKYEAKLRTRASKMDHLWTVLARVTAPRNAGDHRSRGGCRSSLSAAGRQPRSRLATCIAGVPELRADSQYNIDTEVITKHFSIGVDVITVIVESEPEACTRARPHDHHRPLRVAHA